MSPPSKDRHVSLTSTWPCSIGSSIDHRFWPIISRFGELDGTSQMATISTIDSMFLRLCMPITCFDRKFVNLRSYASAYILAHTWWNIRGRTYIIAHTCRERLWLFSKTCVYVKMWIAEGGICKRKYNLWFCQSIIHLFIHSVSFIHT